MCRMCHPNKNVSIFFYEFYQEWIPWKIFLQDLLTSSALNIPKPGEVWFWRFFVTLRCRAHIEMELITKSTAIPLSCTGFDTSPVHYVGQFNQISEIRLFYTCVQDWLCCIMSLLEAGFVWDKRHNAWQPSAERLHRLLIKLRDNGRRLALCGCRLHWL